MIVSTLTVLICTHNRRSLLEKVLQSLQIATPPAASWDVRILVVANACTDDTATFLDAFKSERLQRNRWPVDWMAEPVPGKSHALNAALPTIGGELVAFVDDDHRVDQNYLMAVCAAADSFPDADLFCGRILPDWTGDEPAWVHDSGPYRIYPLPVPRFDQGDVAMLLTPERAIPGGGNLFLRTAWLGRTGNFSTDIGPTGHDLGGSEDLEWVLRAMRLGARLQYVPTVIQHHYVDTGRLTMSYLLKKAYKRTASTVMIETHDHPSLVPRYLWRKVAEYGLRAGTALRSDRRRFYLVRTAAALGEIAGHLGRRRRMSILKPN